MDYFEPPNHRILCCQTLCTAYGPGINRAALISLCPETASTFIVVAFHIALTITATLLLTSMHNCRNRKLCHSHCFCLSRLWNNLHTVLSLEGFWRPANFHTFCIDHKATRTKIYIFLLFLTIFQKDTAKKKIIIWHFSAEREKPTNKQKKRLNMPSSINTVKYKIQHKYNFNVMIVQWL